LAKAEADSSRVQIRMKLLRVIFYEFLCANGPGKTGHAEQRPRDDKDTFAPIPISPARGSLDLARISLDGVLALLGMTGLRNATLGR